MPKPDPVKLLLAEAVNTMENVRDKIKSGAQGTHPAIQSHLNIAGHAGIHNYIFGNEATTTTEKIKTNFFTLLCSMLRIAHSKGGGITGSRGLTQEQARNIHDSLEASEDFKELLQYEFAIQDTKIKTTTGGTDNAISLSRILLNWDRDMTRSMPARAVGFFYGQPMHLVN